MRITFQFAVYPVSPRTERFQVSAVEKRQAWIVLQPRYLSHESDFSSGLGGEPGQDGTYWLSRRRLVSWPGPWSCHWTELKHNSRPIRREAAAAESLAHRTRILTLTSCDVGSLVANCGCLSSAAGLDPLSSFVFCFHTWVCSLIRGFLEQRFPTIYIQQKCENRSSQTARPSGWAHRFGAVFRKSLELGSSAIATVPSRRPLRAAATTLLQTSHTSKSGSALHHRPQRELIADARPPPVAARPLYSLNILRSLHSFQHKTPGSHKHTHTRVRTLCYCPEGNLSGTCALPVFLFLLFLPTSEDKEPLKQ